MNYLLGIVFFYYLFYTARYTIRYVRLDSHFSHRQKIAHGILIWLLPFVWISIRRSC